MQHDDDSEFLPDMERARRGTVVAVSSSMALVGGARLTDYCASKSAVVGLMESLRLELKARRVAGVRTLIVAPFVVDTGMFQGAFAPETDMYVCMSSAMPHSAHHLLATSHPWQLVATVVLPKTECQGAGATYCNGDCAPRNTACGTVGAEVMPLSLPLLVEHTQT